MMKPWIMSQQEAHSLCCILRGHRRTVNVIPNQFGLPFVGSFSLITSIESIKKSVPHPIIITSNPDISQERLFLGLYFKPRDTQIECYTYTTPEKRILHSSYQIKPYTSILIFVEGDFRGMQYAIAEGAAPPYTTVCTFNYLTPELGFTKRAGDIYTEPFFGN